EKIGGRPPLEANATPGIPPSAEEGNGHAVALPDRFVAYLFDDLHLSTGDLPLVRDAAARHLADLTPTDRAAIFTMSGTVAVDFTDDKAQLRGALERLRPGIMTRVGGMTGGDILTFGTLDQIKNVIRRMSGAPGQRTIVMVSPGFMTIDPMYLTEINDILDRAIRANVIINTMDARGLYTDPALDLSRPNAGRGFGGNSLLRASMRADILAELADGTGGIFYQNSNNYDEGFKQLAAAPEYVYVLAFTPQNLKLDGSFHALRVSVKPSNNLNIEARKGYYAPRRLDDADQTAQQEIEAALFSHEEISELPVDLHTQFFKPDPASAKLAVLVHLGLRQFKFRKTDGRNDNVVTMVSGIFDRNGHYLQGIKKVLELRLKDDTLANRITNGVTIRTTFDIKPGTYLVRLVVRDAEGQLMSATNGAVDIP
ncbi:MAG TPA: VWA domain-containing protein, partial [Candidatus Sulfopaludibacter sp.]|nr:VWA domain-containing protein [Candidatus Sulfopaludibacter sp.]